jgi:hypothetical protein
MTTTTAAAAATTAAATTAATTTAAVITAAPGGTAQAGISLQEGHALDERLVSQLGEFVVCKHHQIGTWEQNMDTTWTKHGQNMDKTLKTMKKTSGQGN